MKRFTAQWLLTGGSYVDNTFALGEGTSSTTVNAGETLYLGLDEWFSGALTFVSNPPSPEPAYDIQQYDGDQWRSLPLEETLVNLTSGIQIQRGSLYWGLSPFSWQKLSFSNVYPETATALDNIARYWVRLIVSSGAITVDRVLPQVFNTYATVEEMQGYIGFEFDDLRAPTIDTVRKMLRASEDWFDRHTRRSFRPRVVYNETYDFNPYGIKLRKYPPWFIVSVGIWNGSDFQTMTEGRSQDYYLDQSTGMLRFTLPYMRLRSSSGVLSRFRSQPNSTLITYAWGEDFDVSPYAYDIKRAILMKTGADLINQNDWTAIFTSGLDTVPKPEKLKNWADEAMKIADELRVPLIR